MENKGKVTGIGDIFVKYENPAKIREWYAKYLGIPSDESGNVFESRNIDSPEVKESSVWNPFSKNSKYFEKEWMINFRVQNIERLVEELKKDGNTVVDEITVHDYGKFVHIIDPEGFKIELWEPK